MHLKKKFLSTIFYFLSVSLCFGQFDIVLTEQTETTLHFNIQNESGHPLEIKYKEINALEYKNINVHLRNEIAFSGLKPATVYDVVISNQKEIIEKRFITSSRSSGEIRHFFNHEILEGSTGAIIPDGTSFTIVEKEIRNIIDQAKKTIDYCAYNTNVSSIVNALIDASNRGVRVRIVTDNSTSNSGLKGSLPFEVVLDNSSGLMHNKFIVIDESLEKSALLVTGSMNFTTTQMKSDPNHLIFIQDQSMAKAYTIEFEEMWGSNTAVPNRDVAKFGATKKDNTPHEFTVNGIRIESYFSPSDRTSNKIINTISKANESIDVGLLIFTYNEIKDNLIDRINDGVSVRGIVDDTDDSFENITALNNNGAKIINDPTSSIFHYKMGVFDANNEGSDPTVITGSHNWTFSAETRNDENILIIHDYKITDLYSRALGFFFQQWLTSTSEFQDENIIYPNPGNDLLFFKSDNVNSIIINDLAGRKVLNKKVNGNYIDISGLRNGLYTVEVYLQNEKKITKFLKL